jgi:hypothetical protein
VATIAVIGAALGTVVYGSLLEWFVHGIAFHRWFVRLHALHHAEFSGAAFQRPGPYRNLQRWWFELAAIGVHAPVALVLGVWLGVAVTITVLIVLAVYAAASNILHTSIHCPNGRFIERTAWHRRLVACHREHHLHARNNLSVPTSIGDRIMGSFRAPTSARGRAPTPARSWLTTFLTSSRAARRRG